MQARKLKSPIAVVSLMAVPARIEPWWRLQEGKAGWLARFERARFETLAHRVNDPDRHSNLAAERRRTDSLLMQCSKSIHPAQRRGGMLGGRRALTSDVS